MAELPEIAKLAGQMRDTLCGKIIKDILILQEKCANIPPEEFRNRVIGAIIKDDDITLKKDGVLAIQKYNR